MLTEEGKIDADIFLSTWHSLQGQAEIVEQLPGTVADVDAAVAKLAAHNIYMLAHRPVPNTPQEALYITAKVHNSSQLLLELRFARQQPGITSSFRSDRQDFAPLINATLSQVLS